MVSGLKQGDRVQAKVENVLGRSAAQVRFPETWKDAVLHGVVLEKASGRSWLVKWDGDELPSKLASSKLHRLGESTTTAVSEQRRDVSDAQDEASVMAAASPQSASTDADVDDADDPFDEIPEAPAADPDEVSAASEPGGDKLCPHGLQWVEQPGGVEHEVDGVSSAKAAVRWSVDLGDNRPAIDYFMHFYPRSHVPATLQSTTEALDRHALRGITEQEFFVFLGVLLCIGMFPGMPLDALFSASHPFRGYAFFAAPCLWKFPHLLPSNLQ